MNVRSRPPDELPAWTQPLARTVVSVCRLVARLEQATSAAPAPVDDLARTRR